MTTRDSIKRFDWMGIVLYPLAVILMEAFWVYPWLAWVGGWPMWAETRPPLHLISVVVTLVLALALTRYLADRKHWRLAWIRTAIIGAGLVVFVLVLRLEYPPPEGTGWFAHVGSLFAELAGNPSAFILGLAALIYLWWRGINLGGATSYFRDIYQSFILGMVALIVLLIVWQITSGSENFSAPGAGIGWNVIAFFFFGLLAIAVCHLYNMRATMAKEDAAQTSVWRWLSIMLGVIGAMVLVGFGLAAAFSPEFFSTISSGFRAIGWFFGKVIDIIAIPLNYVFEAIFWVIRFLISLLRNEQQGEEMSGNMSGGDIFGQVETVAIPPAIEEAIKWFVIIVLIGVVVFFLARAINRFISRKQREDVDEFHESVWDMADLKGDLRSMLDGLKDRFTIKRKPRQRWEGDDLSGNLDIREIYRRIQREGVKAGYPRKAHETVEEYARRIGRYIPEVAAPLDGIDGAYENVRYGESVLKDEQVKGANSLWHELRRLLRKVSGEG